MKRASYANDICKKRSGNDLLGTEKAIMAIIDSFRGLGQN